MSASGVCGSSSSSTPTASPRSVTGAYTQTASRSAIVTTRTCWVRSAIPGSEPSIATVSSGSRSRTAWPSAAARARRTSVPPTMSAIRKLTSSAPTILASSVASASTP